MSRRVLVVSAVALLTLGFGGCEDRAAAPAPIRPVLSVAARQQTTETIGPFAGTIQPRYTVPLGFQVFGRLISRDVSIGDVVAKGARLAAIDPAVQLTSMRSAQASLESAEAQLATAAATEERQRTLLEQRVIAQSQFDLTEQNRAAAAANVTQARDRLAKAQDELGYTVLYSSIDGVVTGRSAEVGQVVTAGQTVVTVARPDVREAVFDVPDAVATALPPAATFDVVWDLNPSFRVTGRVREIAPEADPTTRTRRVRLSLDKPPDVFILGTTVLVSRKMDTPPRVELPATALLERDGKPMVWLVGPQSGKVELREVKLGARNASTISIMSGISNGDRVVIAGVHSLSPGQTVRIEGGQ
jgi:RND family efflux transporter MFP subunit